uniref:Long-chain acyl-CoA synthetase n=1 Tax=uncultured crenarchaeote TaxID=29281 RepID=H5SB97_9CREN|nr:long-chain acyl-CoA synthetase [uncultured crenarchaeote]
MAAIFLDTPVTFEALKNFSDRFASALRKLGVGKGSRVMIVLPNSIQFIVSYYGILKTGATVVPVNPLSTGQEIKELAKLSEAKVIVTLDLFIDEVMGALGETTVKHVVVTNIADHLPALKRTLGKILKKIPSKQLPSNSSIMSYVEMISGPVERIEADVNPEKDLASIQFTGGTTGFPKGVMLTHHNIVSNIFQMYEFIRPYLDEANERFAALLPFYHIYGQSVILGAGLLMGNTLVVFPRLELEKFMRDLEKYDVTIFPGVPTLFNLMSNHRLADQLRYPKLKMVISGADMLPPEVAENFEKKFGRKIVEGYGLSEASPVTHVNPPDKVKRGSFGIPIPSTLAAIINPETREFLGPGEVGEIIVSGPQVMQGYLGQDNSNVFLYEAGRKWLRTGDMGQMDSDGYFYFTERAKDIIKHKGFTVFPAEIEKVLYESDAVKEAAVVGIPDPVVGEKIVAAVVLKPGYGPEQVKTLQELCHSKLAEYKRPSEIVLVDDLPKSLVGKMLRRRVRDIVKEKLTHPM